MSSLDDAALIEALKVRLEDLELRLVRFKDRYEKKQSLARWAMQEAGLDKVMAEDFSVGLRKGLEKLDVSDEGRIPAEYFVPQPAKLDRKTVLDALKTGNTVSGASLSWAKPQSRSGCADGLFERANNRSEKSRRTGQWTDSSRHGGTA